MRGRDVRMTRRFKRLTFERLSELEHDCSHCAFWETSDHRTIHCDPQRDEALTLESWFKTVRSEWGECGRVAYEDGEILGIVQYAPARYFPRTRFMTAGRPADDTVLLTSMYLRDEVRHIGLGKVLLHAALRDLVGRGERTLEAYGTTEPACDVPIVGVNFLIGEGFRVVRPDRDIPLLRMELEQITAWTDSLESALEALTIMLPGRSRSRARSRVPTPIPR